MRALVVVVQAILDWMLIVNQRHLQALIHVQLQSYLTADRNTLETGVADQRRRTRSATTSAAGRLNLMSPTPMPAYMAMSPG